MFSSSQTNHKEPYSGTRLRVISKNQNGGSPRGFRWFFLLVLVGGIFLVYHIYNSEKKIAPGVVETPDGDFALSSERKAKLDRELEEIDNAVQYALLANIDGFYPCLSCPFAIKTIYLYEGNVWKYGVTRKKESERYPGGNYGAENLLFFPMFFGTYSECLKQEKHMIYSYPLLPESTSRDIILARPPGNKYDS